MVDVFPGQQHGWGQTHDQPVTFGAYEQLQIQLAAVAGGKTGCPQYLEYSSLLEGVVLSCSRFPLLERLKEAGGQGLMAGSLLGGLLTSVWGMGGRTGQNETPSVGCFIKWLKWCRMLGLVCKIFSKLIDVSQPCPCFFFLPC